MTWLYNGSELCEDDIPDKSMGFIYIITYLPTGQQYIGRKLLTKAHRRQKNKKVIRSRIASDWKDYWSSSPEINKMIEEEKGTHNFTREILMFAPNKSSLNYSEECIQYCLGVLESDHWLNSNIRSKAYKKNVIGKEFVGDIRETLKKLRR